MIFKNTLLKIFNAIFLIIVLMNWESCSDESESADKSESALETNHIAYYPLNLIAYYPLNNNGDDSTGNNATVTLANAPFQSGSIYCNGIYPSAGANPYGCVVETPAINGIDLESFAISMDFNVSELSSQPVWVIGVCARWLGFILNGDGNISMLYNNSNIMTTTTSYSINQWHNAMVVYNNTTASIYLDNSLAGSLEFTPSLDCGGTDTVVGITNYSNGYVFKGKIKNLKVYGPQ